VRHSCHGIAVVIWRKRLTRRARIRYPLFESELRGEIRRKAPRIIGASISRSRGVQLTTERILGAIRSMIRLRVRVGGGSDMLKIALGNRCFVGRKNVRNLRAGGAGSKDNTGEDRSRCGRDE